MSDMAAQDVSLRELLSFGFKYRRRLLLAFFVPFLVAFFISFVPTPRYQASSVLVVRLGSEYVYRPEIGNNQNSPPVNIPFERDQIFKSEVAILNSEDLHAATIKAIGVEKLYPELLRPGLIATITAPLKFIVQSVLDVFRSQPKPTEEDIKRRQLAVAVVLFNQRFDILLEKESAIINVSFEHRDTVLAAQVLEQLLKLYFEKRKQLYLESRVDLAGTQVEVAHTRMVKAEQAVESYKRDNQIYSFSDQRASLLQQRTDIERQLGALNSRQAELSSLLATLDAHGMARPGDMVLYDRGGGDAAMANARIRLIDAESRLKEALAHYTKDSPVVVAARKQVNDAREVLSHAELDRDRAEAELGSIQARRESLDKGIVSYNTQLDHIDAKERDYNALTREAKLAEDDYTQYMRQLDEARAYDKLQRDRSGSVRVIQPPASNPNPKKFQMIIIFVGAFIALISVVLTAATTEFLRSGFYTPEGLERSLGLPVLITVPYRD